MKDLEIIILENKNLILKIASKFSKYYNIEDLFQAGVIGLIKAYKNYDHLKNTKISTYSVKYIYGEILEYVRNDRTIKVGNDYIKLYNSYQKSKDFLTNRNGYIPSLKEISDFMGIEEEKLAFIIEKSQYAVSLDEVLKEDYTLEDTIGTDERSKIDRLLDIKSELEKLKEEERKLILLRYFNDYTQSETAEMLGINQVQVSRYEKLILEKMNKNMTV